MTPLFLHNLEWMFDWLLTASWQASVLALIVLVLQAVLRGRLNPRWRHALWLLVILRLVMPALPESALSLFQFAPTPSPVLLTPVTEPLFAPVAPTSPEVAAIPLTRPVQPLTLYSLLAMGWLAGVLILFGLTWEANRRFARQVAHAPEITEPLLLDLFLAAKAELGVRRSIRLVESGQVRSPAIMGLFSPTLLLPGGVRDRFDAPELRLIFLHELAHLKRGDVIVQGLIAVLQILHWFNPVLWYAFRRIRIDREPATDALVLSRTGEAEKERYGLMLIKLLEHFNQRHSLPTLVGILEDKDQFKRRFSLIARFTRGAYGWSVLGILLIGILGVACLTAKESDTTNASTKSKTTTPPPIYVWYNKIGMGFFGPVAHDFSLSDNSHIPGTDHRISVYCRSFTATEATLVFIVDSDSTRHEIGETEAKIPLGKVYSFRIFNSVDVTTSPTIKPISPESAAKDASTSATSINAQMLQAVQKGDAQTVQKLIDQGVDPKAIDKDGSTLLFDAGSPKVAEILLQYGADLNARNKQDDAALNCLCRNGGKNAAAIVRVLLKHGADPNTRIGEFKETPLMDAQDGATVDVLMEYGADPKTTMTDGEGLLLQAGRKDLGFLEALLRHGVAFNAKTDGPTVLLQASWVDNTAVMKWLLAHGVDPNTPGVWVPNKGHPDMMLPMRAAAISGQPEAAKLLMEHGAKAGDQMIIALNNRYAKIVKLLWEAGVRDISPLCYAVSQGATAADVQKLLDQGSPADPPQDQQITPLGDAAMLGNMEVIKVLIAHHADVNAGGMITPKAPSYYKMTPLWLAAGEGQDEIVTYLLQHGASPDPAALYQAGFNSYPYPDQRSKDHFEKTARILIDAGALKNITPDMAGLVLAGPLGTRCGPPNPTVLKMLLDAGISPESPMPYIVENGEKPNSVIGFYRDYYQKRKDDPTYGQEAATIKPLLDMLEAADKGAGLRPPGQHTHT